MQLANHVKDLLYRYECVIVPGFGAFLTHYKPAQVDGESHTWHPPGKSLSFNRQLQTNDGLLANYIATAESCSYELALQKIRNAVGDLSLKLSEGTPIIFPNLGTFKLNEERSLQFKPHTDETFSATSFGLAPFVSLPISREVYKKQAEAIEEKAPVYIIPEKREFKPYLKYAAIGLLAVTLAGFGGMKLYENNVEAYNLAEREKANTMVEKQIQEATFIMDNPLPALTVTVEKEQGRYHIVAGAFRVAENAKKKQSQLQEKGFKAKLIGENRYGLHQVVYSSHEDRLEALRTLRQIKQTENKDAWLLVKDLSK
ncbi:SPOR domain-containing protein [Flavobacteriaceae bacterium TK19130]|nr:SPOR domain-containing protein [Thermobacterium salinum]